MKNPSPSSSLIAKAFLAFGFLVLALCLPSHAALYTWNSSSTANFSTAGSWLVSGAVPGSAPSSSDSLVNPVQFGTSTLSSGTTTINNLTYSVVGTSWIINANGGGDATLNINGTLTKSGASTVTFSSSSGSALSLNIGAIDLQAGGGNGMVLGLSGSGALAALNVTGNANLARATTVVMANGTTSYFNAVTVGDDFSFAASLATGHTTTARVTSLSGTGTVQATTNTSNTYTATLDIDTSTTSTFSGRIRNQSAGTGVATVQVVKNGTGTQILTGDLNAYTGGTTINNGTLQLGSGGTTGVITGNVNTTASGATLAINRSNSYTFAGTISGSGRVSQMGSGTTTLSSASNSYSGGTVVSAGTLLVTGSGQLGSGGVSVSGGALRVSASSGISNAVTLTNAAASYVLDRTVGQSYGVYSSSSDLTSGIDTAASILAGSASGTKVVTTSFAIAPDSATNDGIRNSDVFKLSGTDTDLFVLQLGLADGITSSNVVGWLNGSNTWVNAVDGNTGNNASGGQLGYAGTFASFQTTYGTDLSLYVGAYGYDTSADTTWAVLNHNSDFATVTMVPEPASILLLGFGLIVVMWKIRSRRQKV